MISVSSVLVKLLLPAAFAVGVPNFHRAPASPASFVGTYDAIPSASSTSCAPVLTAELDSSTNSLRFSDGESIVYSFPQIDQGQVAYSNVESNGLKVQGTQSTRFDGYRTLRTDIGIPSNRSIQTTIADYNYGDLTITHSLSYALSRGQGGKSETCRLRKQEQK